MMRIKSGMLAVITGVVLFVYACSSGGSQDPGADAAAAPRCGDGICNATEVNSCPADCGANSNAVCGNGMCEANKGETSSSCPTDCGSGSGSNTTAMCGNGVCEAGENSSSCPQDCGSGSGSGNLDCNDETVIDECFNCIFDGDCTGVDEPDCEVCLGL